MLPEAFWTAYAAVYDEAQLFGYRSMLELVLGLVVPKRDLRVVDAGCGTLNFGIALNLRNPGATVVGLDSNRAMLQCAGRKISAREGVSAFVHDFDRTSWPDKHVDQDLIISANMLYTLQDPEKFLGEASAALKTGGQLLLVNMSDPDVRKLMGDHMMWRLMRASPQELAKDDARMWAVRAAITLNGEIARASAGRTLNVYPESALVSRVEAAGFSVAHSQSGVYSGTCVLVDARKR